MASGSPVVRPSPSRSSSMPKTKVTHIGFHPNQSIHQSMFGTECSPHLQRLPIW
jgi:hypothetical protein